MVSDLTVDQAIEEAEAKVEKGLENKRIYEPFFEIVSQARCAQYVPERPVGGPTERTALLALITLAHRRLAEMDPPTLGEHGYQMKDLGYPRTACPAFFELTANHRVFRFPAQLVVDSRDEHYRDDKHHSASQVGFSGCLDV